MRGGWLVALCWVGVAGAAMAEPLGEARVALVREFLEVTETGGGTVPLRNAFVDQVDQSYPETFDAMLSELSLPPESEEAARQGYAESLARFRAEFSRQFDAQIDLEVLARVLYAPIYARHFTDDELRELTAFYRTPTGRKSLSALPVAMTEVTLQVVPALAPLINSLVNEVVASEKLELAKAVSP